MSTGERSSVVLQMSKIRANLSSEQSLDVLQQISSLQFHNG